MSRFLIACWPYAGHYFPAVAIAEGLRGRGHDVAFYSGGAACAVIANQGFACFPFRHVDARSTDGIVLSPRRDWSWRRPLHVMAAYRALFLDTIPSQLRDLEEIFSTWHPDVLICDATLLGPILVLHELHNLPIAAYSVVAGCMIPGPDAPITGLGLPPPGNWVTRQRAYAIQAVKNRVVADFQHTANRLRRRYGLAPLGASVLEYTARMPLYLVRGAPEFDYERRDLPASVRYVGPLLWSPPEYEQPSPWLLDLPREQPWVLVAESSLDTGKNGLFHAATTGLANFPAQVIITTGARYASMRLADVATAPNLHITDWVSHAYTLPRAGAVISVGGAGTILSALAAGAPLIVIPAEADQPDNARRVVETRTGLKLSRRQCTPAGLRHALEHVLSDPQFGVNARRMAGIFRGYDGASRAAELIEGLCR